MDFRWQWIKMLCYSKVQVRFSKIRSSIIYSNFILPFTPAGSYLSFINKVLMNTFFILHSTKAVDTVIRSFWYIIFLFSANFCLYDPHIWFWMHFLLLFFASLLSCLSYLFVFPQISKQYCITGNVSIWYSLSIVMIETIRVDLLFQNNARIKL